MSTINIKVLDLLRVNTDELALIAFRISRSLSEKRLYTTAGSLNESKNRLLMAKAWLGKAKGCLGAESPYKNDGKRKSIEDIEPTDAKVYSTADRPENLIENMDLLREQIQKIIDIVEVMGTFDSAEYPNAKVRETAICRTNAYNYLCEAKFLIGFAFETLKHEQARVDAENKV